MKESEFVSWNGVPYEVYGTYLNGDKKLVIHGSMKDFDRFRIMSFILSGRFNDSELIPISRQQADELKNSLIDEKRITR